VLCCVELARALDAKEYRATRPVGGTSRPFDGGRDPCDPHRGGQRARGPYWSRSGSARSVRHSAFAPFTPAGLTWLPN